MDGDAEESDEDRFIVGGRRLLRPTALAGSADVDSSLGGSFYTQHGRGTFTNSFGDVYNATFYENKFNGVCKDFRIIHLIRSVHR